MNQNDAFLSKKVQPESDLALQPSPIIGRHTLQARWLQWKIFWSVFFIGYARFRDFKKTITLMRRSEKMRRDVFGDFPIQKIAKVNGRFYWDLSAPGYPSVASSQYFQNSFSLFDASSQAFGLRAVYFSITNKCSLQCEHCYEWPRLNRKDLLSTVDLIDIIKKYQEYGVGVFFLEGGEPFLRWKGLIELLKSADDTSDFWIITSGYHLTAEKAKILRKQGLTGVMVSLDHYQEALHNRFRGDNSAFEDAINAVINANSAGLVTALSICATRDFVNRQNLRRYLALARRLGVSFVQILEPQPIGHYAGKDIQLYPKQQRLLTSFYLQNNGLKKYRSYPIIFYPAYHQRRLGCQGAGSRYLFIDSDGNVQLCPFCRSDLSLNALALSVPDIIGLLKSTGCQLFEDYEKGHLSSKKNEAKKASKHLFDYSI